jgi:succinoglycan biosynthesis protein ExoA
MSRTSGTRTRRRAQSEPVTSTDSLDRTTDQERESQKNASWRPVVSVVLPIRNEARYIDACLERLFDQDYPRDLIEIIVVDGSSTDGTQAILREIQQRHPEVRLRIVNNRARRVPQGLNSGIRAARGEIIVRLDGHTVPAHDYVTASVAALERSGAANVGGVVEPIGDTPFGNAVAAATKHPLGVGDAKFRTGGAAGDVDTVPFGAFRREVFRHVGLFDEGMVRNQDYEMNVRIRSAGLRVFLDPAIRFTYTPRGTVRGLWQQYFEYGWWRVQTIRRHPSSVKWRQAIPPAFVASMIALATLGFVWAPAAVAFFALAGVYGATVAAVSFAVAAQKARPHLVALAFVVMHFAYGLGFVLNSFSGGKFPYRAGPPLVPELHDGSEVVGWEDDRGVAPAAPPR